MLKEFDFNRGAHLRMSWIQDRYKELVVAHRCKVSARVYMLQIVASTLFEDKLGVYIDTRNMWLFNSLDVTSWACGCVVLTILYTTLEVATSFETKQLAGYLSLLQIYLKLLFVVEFFFNLYE